MDDEVWACTSWQAPVCIYVTFKLLLGIVTPTMLAFGMEEKVKGGRKSLFVGRGISKSSSD